MKNLSFLKGLVVGIGIATIGGVVYANSISADAGPMNSWATIKNDVYVCVTRNYPDIHNRPYCIKAEMR